MKPSAKSSSTPQKRQWTESQEDGPLPVDVHTPENHDRKKKKKKHEAEEDDASPPPPASEPLTSSKKKKKKNQEGKEEHREKEICDAVETPMTERKKKKKEKRKSRPSEESDDTEAAEHDDEFTNTIQKKKKKKQNIMNEESVDAEAKDLTSETFTKGKKQKRRRSMQSEESIITEETEQNDREKKKKKQEVIVATVTPGHQSETTGASVTIETKTDDRKQKTPKKKKKGENVDEDTFEGELTLDENRVEEIRQSTKQTTRKIESAEDDRFDPALLGELQEFIPDVKKRSAIVVNKMLRYDLARFKEFRKQGVPLRQGRCSEEENDQIRKNMADFMLLVGISSPIKLLFPKRFKGEEMEIKKLKIQHHFFERLAEGIPRPCQQVYTRARKLFDNRNHMGRFSNEEVQSLIKLQNLHGNNWKAIAEKMDRSVHALEKRFATIDGDKGVWSPDEESRLKKALKGHFKVLVQQSPEASGLTREQLCNNLPWKEISKKVGTRHWIQCRVKWFTIIKSRMFGGATFDRGPNGIQAKIQLINTLYNMQVDDASDIDWDEVANTIGDVTSVCVQKSLYRLKASRVPNWTKLSFGEIIDYLHSKVIPILQEKLKKYRAQEVKSETQQQEITYQLSDIFSSQKEQEFVEVDNTQRSSGRSRL